jgi:lipopolysaccharide/colanic/teichoic acid biosynthesis glycosyltransferase
MTTSLSGSPGVVVRSVWAVLRYLEDDGAAAAAVGLDLYYVDNWSLLIDPRHLGQDHPRRDPRAGGGVAVPSGGHEVPGTS